MPTDKTRVNLSVPDHTMDWLEIAARKEKRSLAGLALILMEEGLRARFATIEPENYDLDDFCTPQDKGIRP